MYMAPEQLSGRGVDRRVDLWALGVVLFWSVTGRAPYRGASHSDIIRQVLISEPPKLRDLKPSLPARLEAIVQRALARNPDDRYRDALALRADLQEVIAGRRLGPADVARCVEALGLKRDDTERVPAAIETEPSMVVAPSSTAETLQPNPSGPSAVSQPSPSAPTAHSGPSSAGPQISTGGDPGPSHRRPRAWTSPR